MPILRRMALMSVARAIRSTPSTMIAPPVGSSSRLQQRSSVLLPEPDGPMMKTSSCARNAEVDAPQHLRRAEALQLQAAQDRCVQDRHALADAVSVTARSRSVALGCVCGGRIVARHAGHAVAREHRDGGRAGRRLRCRTTSRASRAMVPSSFMHSIAFSIWSCAARRSPCASAPPRPGRSSAGRRVRAAGCSSPPRRSRCCRRRWRRRGRRARPARRRSACRSSRPSSRSWLRDRAPSSRRPSPC